MRWMVVVLFMTSCAPSGNARVKRWPTHRQQGDARFADLEKRMHELEARVRQLEAPGQRAPRNDTLEGMAPAGAATTP